MKHAQTLSKTVNQKIDEALGIESGPDTPTEVAVRQPSEVSSSGNPDKDMQDDMNFARTAIHSLIDKSTELVDNANFFAREKQDARSVEAAAMAQKEARENILALAGLHKTKKEIERITSISMSGGGDTNITQNAVFVGTTGDLLKFTKDMNKNGALDKALKILDVQATAVDLNTDEQN
jgi:hypothetical protein